MTRRGGRWDWSADGRRVRFDADRGARNVNDLGGFEEWAAEMLDELPNDERRRRMLFNWYGFDGAEWAWEMYLTRRRTGRALPGPSSGSGSP